MYSGTTEQAGRDRSSRDIERRQFGATKSDCKRGAFELRLSTDFDWLRDERFQLKRFIVDSIPLPPMSRIMSRVKSSARERARESQAVYSSESIRENEAKGKFRCRLRNLVNWKYLVKQLLYVQTLDGSNSKPRVV